MNWNEAAHRIFNPKIQDFGGGIMEATRKLAILLMAVALGFGIGACERKGPAERAGEKVDKAVEGAGDKVEHAGEKVGGAAERAAEKVEEKTDRK
jgi:hyperosmotically inducible protein